MTWTPTVPRPDCGIQINSGSAAVTLVGTGAAALAAGTPARIPHAEAFRGIHFNFHAGEDCGESGRHTTPEMAENSARKGILVSTSTTGSLSAQS